MDSLALLLVIFALGLATLVKASDFFTDAAERLGLALGLPPFIVGVTIVSIGTSLPELLSSLVGISQGAPEVVASNVIGSNIANICLVIGIAAIMSKTTLRVLYNLLSVDLPLFIGSAFLFSLMAMDGLFSRGEAVILVIGYVIYLLYILQSGDEESQPQSGEGLAVSDSGDGSGTRGASGTSALSSQCLRDILILVLSGIFIFLGAKYTIDALIQISSLLNIGKDVIAISAVALGTSLPELMVTINAALKGKAELAVGNVVGSNIFNIFIVMGIPGLISPLPISESLISHSVPTLLSASLLMFFIVQDNKVTIWEGWLFIMLYAWFMGATFQLL